MVIEFKSGREMANYFKIDGKIARAAIALGEYQDFILRGVRWTMRIAQAICVLRDTRLHPFFTMYELSEK